MKLMMMMKRLVKGGFHLSPFCFTSSLLLTFAVKIIIMPVKKSKQKISKKRGRRKNYDENDDKQARMKDDEDERKSFIT